MEARARHAWLSATRGDTGGSAHQLGSGVPTEAGRSPQPRGQHSLAPWVTSRVLHLTWVSPARLAREPLPAAANAPSPPCRSSRASHRANPRTPYPSVPSWRPEDQSQLLPKTDSNPHPSGSSGTVKCGHSAQPAMPMAHPQGFIKHPLCAQLSLISRVTKSSRPRPSSGASWEAGSERT